MHARIASLARLGAVALLPLLAAARHAEPPVEGWSFVWTSTSTPTSPGDMTMQVRLAGNRMRLDFGKPMPGTSAGSYMLVDAEKTQMTMVSPKEKAATIMPLGGLAAVLGSIGATGLMKVEVSDISVTVEDLGGGEAILGRPTHRYNLKQSYSMLVSVIGIKRGGKTESSTEMWVTRDLPAGEQRAFEEFGKNFAQSMGSGSFGGEGMKKLTEELRAKTPRGFPLRQVATSKQTDQGGKVTTSTTTTEVQEIKRASLDEKLFEIPADYTVTDMSAMAEEADAKRREAKADCEKEKGVGKCDDVNRDSLRKATDDSAKAARSRESKQAVDDATGVSAIKRIGDLFGKKKNEDSAKKAAADSAKKATADTAKKKPPTP